jgi:hypothetical protein
MAQPQPVRRPPPPVQPAAYDRRDERPVDPAPTGGAGSGGWVADLLRRASRDEPRPTPQPAPRGDVRDFPASGGRSPKHVEESLNSLSVDIVRAIDNDAFMDLWARYTRGEPNVFTRRLYTLQGQATYDEIRRKYQRDGEFRASVDRYVSDFERLLDDVTREGRDASAYLNGDTGKVYTMLAHASGRFE